MTRKHKNKSSNIVPFNNQFVIFENCVDITQYFHLPINEAAHQLGICSTLLKKICRQNGIERWPYRKIKSIQALAADFPTCARLTSALEALMIDPNIPLNRVLNKSERNALIKIQNEVRARTRTPATRHTRTIIHKTVPLLTAPPLIITPSVAIIPQPQQVPRNNLLSELNLLAAVCATRQVPDIGILAAVCVEKLQKI